MLLSRLRCERMRWLGLACVSIAATTTSACSLVFDASPSSSSNGDGSVSLLPFSDSFDGEVRPEWKADFANGDSCAPSDIVWESGGGALRCTTNSVSGTRAGLVLEIPDVPVVRIEMDVLVRRPGQIWISFATARYESGIEVQDVVSMDYYRAGTMSVTHFQESGFDYANLSGIYDLDVWHHVDTLISFPASGTVTTEMRVNQNSAELATPSLHDSVNRVLIGSLLTRDPDEATEIFIDNLSIRVP